MSAQNTAVTLKEILLGISDSLNDAQHQLRSAAPYDEYGRPNTLYTLPYLDFTLQVEAEASQDVETVLNYNASIKDKTENMEIMPRKSYPVSYAPEMLFRPVNKTTNSKDAQKITSTISGRFVAIAPNEGLPQLIINAQPVATQSEGLYDIAVHVFNSAGENIEGALIEFNYNEDKTTLLNPDISLKHDTKFSTQSEARTNAQGKTIVQVAIGIDDYQAKANIQIDINIGTVITKISIQKQ